jgi:hypothetical protein
MTLSVEAQTLTEFKQAVEDTLIQLLKTTYTSDWQVDTNGFTDNRIYTSKTVNIFFSCLGYKL